MKCSNCNTKVEIVELEWINDCLISVEGYRCSKCGNVFISKVIDNRLRIDLFKSVELEDEIKSINYSLLKYKNSKEVNTNMCQRKIKVYENKLKVLQQELDTLNKMSGEYITKIEGVIGVKTIRVDLEDE